jgi:hypothetical protein
MRLQPPPAGKDSWPVKSIQPPPRSLASRPVVCDLAAAAVIRAAPAELPALRQKPGRVAGEPLPTTFLKHSDEQTVVGLSAVLRAIEDHGLTRHDFRDWGVVAVPRFFGRGAFAIALERFRAEGAWGISPHLIPHRTLHSLSGSVSQALKIHGPNFGAGGGPASVIEGLLCAAALLAGGTVPGVWLVMTGWQPELAVDRQGNPTTPDVACQGVALALVPPTPGSRSRLHVTAAGAKVSCPDGPFTLEALTTAIAETSAGCWELPGSGSMALERRSALQRPHMNAGSFAKGPNHVAVEARS